MNQPHDPAFSHQFDVESIGDGSVTIRHRGDGLWWRFVVAEKNGRLQLVHDAHGAEPEGADIRRLAIDAYDTATLEARRHRMVD